MSKTLIQIEPRDWLIATSLMKGIGRQTLAILLPYFRTFGPEYSQEIPSLISKLPILPRLKKILARVTPDYVLNVKRKLAERCIDCVTSLDSLFPPILSEIPDPPFVLYTRGNKDLLTKHKIAIVGTRVPTTYGRTVAFELARSLSANGFAIVSGLAKGIDARAHFGALAAEGSTIAVLGCGIDVVYPSENAGLYSQIEQKALLISEYPPGTPPSKTYFPERNRIISGLSYGVVVVESAKRSGTNITVDCALEQGREVFAVPGSIFSPQSEGPHHWIKQGAKLTTSANEIIEEFGWLTMPRDQEEENFDSYKEIEVNQTQLLDIIENKQLTMEDICTELGVSLQEGIQSLVALELCGKIRRLPGNRFDIVQQEKSLTNGLGIFNNRED